MKLEIFLGWNYDHARIYTQTVGCCHSNQVCVLASIFSVPDMDETARWWLHDESWPWHFFIIISLMSVGACRRCVASVAVCIVDLEPESWNCTWWHLWGMREFIFQQELASPLDYCQISGKEMLLWIWISKKKKGFFGNRLNFICYNKHNIYNHVITM